MITSCSLFRFHANDLNIIFLLFVLSCITKWTFKIPSSTFYINYIEIFKNFQILEVLCIRRPSHKIYDPAPYKYNHYVYRTDSLKLSLVIFKNSIGCAVVKVAQFRSLTQSHVCVPRVATTFMSILRRTSAKPLKGFLSLVSLPGLSCF